ncbi:MAG: hypothetical protein HN352_02640 [Bacteroidetes bacterium]|jgi:peptidyl-prolyl cis-trans isomerase SurA|nr:hypothetical protein [Bacteroidota bacterium]MBT3749195.1 hypothetical protein [Bacteroidota bacterium]MBT4399772.1 hypothetical protein [Bacteroidota bacterium]MBT4410325.1 hypothetical protein [Bacteroidota bacterium]MBT5426512.1 hypothetical protein [Bacteroidota bacterium]
MKRIILGLLFPALFFGIELNGQDQVLFTLDGEAIMVSEFTRILNKNIQNNTDTDLKEALDLFVNFKLKVKEAHALGFDTTQQFIRELERNRKEIAKPYLLDQTVNEELLEEAYQRSLEEIRSSHILVGVKMDAPPSDTLRAYQKAMKIRNRLLAGESFDAVAREVSEDPSAQTNGGDLGYYTVFQLVYPFENAVYNTPVGSVSHPVRTQFGYHVIKVTERQAARGQIQVAVILKAFNYAMTDEEKVDVKNEIFRLYDLIQDGEEFSDIAEKYSDDRNTGNRGGITRWFGIGEKPRDFEDASFSLVEDGQISEPVETGMGWYIIKRIGIKDNPPRIEVEPSLIRSISRDTRSAKSRKVIAEKLKSEYNYKLNKKNYEEFYRLVDPSIFSGTWDPTPALQKLGVLFSLGDLKVLQREFAEFLALNMNNAAASTIAEFIDGEFKKFEESHILDYEETQLERKYPEFKYLYQEFRDGNLLFEITDQLVWSKAVKDSLGLQQFYEENKNNYLWDDRIDGFIIQCKSKLDSDQFANKVQRELNRQSKKDLNYDQIIELIGGLTDTQSGDSFEIKTGPFSKGDNWVLDEMRWKRGISDITKEKDVRIIVWIQNVLKPEPKALDEAKGQITADYQDYLEKEWVKSLKNKYSVIVNEQALRSIEN